jgi:hypothetical protein
MRDQTFRRDPRHHLIARVHALAAVVAQREGEGTGEVWVSPGIDVPDLRQQQPGDWGTVINEVARALAACSLTSSADRSNRTPASIRL